MNKKLSRWVLLLILALIIGGIFSSDSNLQPLSSLEHAVAFISNGVKLLHGLQQTAPFDGGDTLSFRASVPPSTNADHLSLRQSQPSWGGLDTAKPSVNLLGFFFAIMVILLFSRFYQSARTSSEGEPSEPCTVA